MPSPDIAASTPRSLFSSFILSIIADFAMPSIAAERASFSDAALRLFSITFHIIFLRFSPPFELLERLWFAILLCLLIGATPAAHNKQPSYAPGFIAEIISSSFTRCFIFITLPIYRSVTPNALLIAGALRTHQRVLVHYCSLISRHTMLLPASSRHIRRPFVHRTLHHIFIRLSLLALHRLAADDHFSSSGWRRAEAAAADAGGQQGSVIEAGFIHFSFHILHFIFA